MSILFRSRSLGALAVLVSLFGAPPAQAAIVVGVGVPAPVWVYIRLPRPMWSILLTYIQAVSSLALLSVLFSTGIGIIGDDRAAVTGGRVLRELFSHARRASLQRLNCSPHSFPLAFEERLTHNFARKLQILEHIGRALGFLVGSKFDIELFLRILSGADKYNLCPLAIKEVSRIYGNKPPPAESLCNSFGNSASCFRPRPEFGGLGALGFFTAMI